MGGFVLRILVWSALAFSAAIGLMVFGITWNRAVYAWGPLSGFLCGWLPAAIAGGLTALLLLYVIGGITVIVGALLKLCRVPVAASRAELIVR